MSPLLAVFLSEGEYGKKFSLVGSKNDCFVVKKTLFGAGNIQEAQLVLRSISDATKLIRAVGG